MRLHRRHVERLGGHIPARFTGVGGWFRPVTNDEWDFDEILCDDGSLELRSHPRPSPAHADAWVPCTNLRGSGRTTDVYEPMTPGLRNRRARRSGWRP